MSRRTAILGLGSLVLTLLGVCHAKAEQHVWAGAHAAARMAGIEVIRNQERWVEVWGNLLNSAPPRTLPDGHVGVLIALGPRRTGGYAVEITAHGQLACVDVVGFAERRPEPNAYVTQAFTMPWLIAIVPGGARPIVLEKHEADGGKRLIIPTEEASRLAQMGEACSAQLRQR